MINLKNNLYKFLRNNLIYLKKLFNNNNNNYQREFTKPNFQKDIHFESFKVERNWPRQHSAMPQLEIPVYEGSTFSTPIHVNFDDYFTNEHFHIVKKYYQKKNLIVKSQGERLNDIKFFL